MSLDLPLSHILNRRSHAEILITFILIQRILTKNKSVTRNSVMTSSMAFEDEVCTYVEHMVVCNCSGFVNNASNLNTPAVNAFISYDPWPAVSTCCSSLYLSVIHIKISFPLTFATSEHPFSKRFKEVCSLCL